MRSGVVASPNIWKWPDVYETENRAQDVAGAVWAAIEARVPLAGATVVDVGCGTGFHLPRFAAVADRVIGVEPHPALRRRARRRVAELSTVSVVSGAAQGIPLPDGSVDVLHARTAYFFGPGCEPGLREADRLLRPGGALVIVDLDGNASPYGDWLRADTPNYHPRAIEEFFAAQGFSSVDVATRWVFDSRSDLEAVLGIEFSPRVAAQAMKSVPDKEIPVGYRVRVRTRPTGIILG